MWEKLFKTVLTALQKFFEQLVTWLIDVLLAIVGFLADVFFWFFEGLFGWILHFLPDPAHPALKTAYQVGGWLDKFIPFDAIFYTLSSLLTLRLAILVLHGVMFGYRLARGSS